MKKSIVYCMIMAAILLTACQKKQAMYEGKNLTDNAQIVRDKQSKSAVLYIDTEGPWKLYAGKSVENINLSKPLLEASGSGAFNLDVPDSVRSYFQLVTNDGKAILAERHLPMTGGYNFRDLGGMQTKDGRYVKWGKIFRSDDLANLTPADLDYLAAIPVKTIVDFRSQSEITMAQDRLPSSVATDVNLNIEPGNIMGSDIDFDIDTIDFNQVMIRMNRLLVTDSDAIAQYKKFFSLLQDESNIPLMYHCSAGKDRTGMATALILYALGVDDDIIMNDYLASATYLADKYDRYVQQFPAVEPLMTVKSEFLQAGIDQIKQDHGTVENYLKNVLNVDIDKMKQMFLY